MEGGFWTACQSYVVSSPPPPLSLREHLTSELNHRIFHSGDMPIDEAKLREIEKAVLEAEVALEGSGSDGLNGWEGGDVWLVPTDRDIPEWKPIATRAL